MENEDIKNNLIELIKKFDNKCPDCGKIFLGKAIVGSTESGDYPVEVGLFDYPLSCGKCPDCAQKCFDGIHKYVKIHGTIPCDVDTIYEYNIEKDNTRVFTDAEIKEFIDDEMKYHMDCWMYCDKIFQQVAILGSDPYIKGGVLIDLFEFLKDELKDNKQKKGKE